MVTPPRVSVVLPTRNRGPLLGRAIASVLAQTWTDFELIVVDDASTDDTPRRVAAFRDPRLRCERLPANRGAAAARNHGVGLARGELVAFHDDDDVWLIDKLRRQLERLAAAPEAGLCLCAHVRIGARGVRLVGGADAFARMDFRAGPLGGFGVIATPGWLVRRAALAQAGGFDEALKVWDDWELALRLSRVCGFVHVDEPLFLHDRVQGGAMWRNERGFAADMRRILDRHRTLWDGHPRELARLQLVVAQSEARFGSLRESRAWIGRALRGEPLRPKAWLLLAATLGGRRAVDAGLGAWRAARRRPSGRGG